MVRTLAFALAIGTMSGAQAQAIPAVGEFNCINAVIFTGYCIAPAAGSSSRTEGRLYTGLSWTLGGSSGMRPDIVFGYSSSRVSGRKDLKGADLSVRVSFEKSLKVDSVRLVHVDGTRSAQANIGFGYSYSSKGFILVGAAQLPHLKLGTDYSISNKKFTPFLELNTLKKAKAATGSACSIGSLTPEGEIIDYNPIYSQSVIFTNGQTCLSPAGVGPVGPV